VFGGDYPTGDGTGVRDYIHVVDLAVGHLASLSALAASNDDHVTAINLGTGQGYSVLDMVKAFEVASGKRIPYQIVGRRAGDVASVYADARRANSLLGWQATRGIADMCADSWRWQSHNPDGLPA